MTPKEKLALFERVANAFECEPRLMAKGCYVRRYASPGTVKSFCAIGAAAGLAGALTPGGYYLEIVEEAEEWCEMHLPGEEAHVIAEANDETRRKDRPEAIRKAARELWAK